MLMLADYYNQKINAEQRIVGLLKEIHEQEIQHLNHELEFKNKELTSKAMFIFQKDELIAKIIDQLKGLTASKDPTYRRDIETIMKQLRLNLKDNNWKEFETYFENVHEDFYNKLKLKYPALSPNEKKLCAFIRLNLGTKEICSLTHQSTKSVEVARVRLRQKMNLTRDENLNVIVSNI
jgi:hypothetical protein